MSTTELVDLMRQQLELQRQQIEDQRKESLAQREQMQQQMEALVNRLAPGNATTSTAAYASFAPFDPTSELWKDYKARFDTFAGANSIAPEKLSQVFLTNQTTSTYKLLSTLAGQQTPPQDINKLTLDDISVFMQGQFDPKRFIVRERFKFWSDMKRKPGESVQELAARIRQDASKCDFAAIKDPQDEAMRTRFICCINNEAVLKALFRIHGDDLTFSRAIQVASETEDAAKVAKETVYGTRAQEPVFKLDNKPTYPKHSGPRPTNGKPSKRQPAFPKGTCYRCGKTDHAAKDCRFKEVECHYCQKKGHIESVCMGKQRAKQVSHISAMPVRVVHHVDSRDPIFQTICLFDKPYAFEIDTGSPDNFCSKTRWHQLGQPGLKPPHSRYVGATGNVLPVRGRFFIEAVLPSGGRGQIEFNVSENPLNLLGRSAVRRLGIDVTSLCLNPTPPFLASPTDTVGAINSVPSPDTNLQGACNALCDNFPDLFKPELGCLKGYELEVKFKPDAEPIFCKPRTVPLALLDDLNQAYDAGMKRGVWQPTQFNPYGTPVVPIRKPLLPGQTKRKLRVCGDYSVTVNPQLETHRHPMPLPEDLMRKLSGGYYFTKIDLADAYNQIVLAPETKKRLALSTHRGVLLQDRLPFGISSAPGYFQEIMEQLTSDLSGVAVYLDDILVSGDNAEEHLNNLRALLVRLQEKGLRCKKEKCAFAQPSVEYLGHTLSREGIAKGSKVDAVLKMPPPTSVTELRSFLGSVQFYAKFIPNLSTMTEPLHRLTRKDVPWKWGAVEQAAFQALKDALCTDAVLAHFDPTLDIGISCDASQVGLGVVLFHRYPDGSERPIANASKTLTDTQQRYSQIQKEALSVIFALTKFHQFLYGRKFILITDHKPLLALFGPTKGTPLMAANRLARWALHLSQYEYSIEYRRTDAHSNADALSRLPCGTDTNFDGEEEQADTSMVCSIKQISLQLDPLNPKLITKETGKDPVLSTVMRYVKEGWPATLTDEEVKPFRKLSDSLSTENGCLFHGLRIVIPKKLRDKVLDLIHLGHFGMQRMKQLARTAVYWPHIDTDIEKVSRLCGACAEHQNKPPKPANHPWMLPERPWSRLHMDHAINFLGSNWLVLVDSYSKYPCIHPTSSITTKATTDLLEQDFAHFGYPHTIVTDNATSFLSEEFQLWCQERGITHLTGAPYHPATNGAAERLVQTFKQSMRKSSLPPKAALQEFLLQYRRTPFDTGYSPSELLNGRQLRCKLDTLAPSPVHAAQGKQAREATKSQMQENTCVVSKLAHTYQVGAACYALYCGPKRTNDPRWIPAVVTKVYGTRSVSVRVFPRGPVWRRHIDQLRPRYATHEDAEPVDTFPLPARIVEPTLIPLESATAGKIPCLQNPKPRNPRLPTGLEYGSHNPRRSSRLQKSKDNNASGYTSAGGKML